jgi:hypothetical protein
VLIAYNYQKISTENDKTVGELLVIICDIIGLSEEKQPSDVLPFIRHLKTAASFSKMSLFDIVNAFEFGVRGITDMMPPALNSYNSFSSIYIDRVIDSYKRYIYSALYEVKKNAVPERNAEKVSPEKEKEILIQGCLEAFEKYKNGKKIIDFGNPKYNYLSKIGLIEVPPMKMKKFMEQATSSFYATAYHKALNIPNTIEGEAKLLLLKDYFKYLISTDQELKDIIYDTDKNN